MCEPVSIIAAAGVAVSAAGAVASHQQGAANAKAQGHYNMEVQISQTRDKVANAQWQNEVYAQDIEYAFDTLAWAEKEWARQVEYDVEARKAVEKNTLAAVGQVMLRQVEEDMSVIVQGAEVRRQGTIGRAQIAARSADRGVEGNSVDAIINDVTRQEGEVHTVLDMNRSAVQRQLNREAIALDAQGDQQLASIALKTYGPSTPIRAPSPTGSVAPAAPVSGPNTGALITGLAGAVTGGISAYSSMSGQTTAQTLKNVGSWASRNFTI